MKMKLVIIFIVLCAIIITGYTYFRVLPNEFNSFDEITTIEIEDDSISIGKVRFPDNQ